jgi:uracil-DNA glycosylase family 4
MKKIIKYCKECPYADRAGLVYENVCKKDALFVSNYPYESDLKSGSVFSGKDSLVFSELLKLINLKKSDVCLTNACRCVMDKKNDSTKEKNSAINYCREYLKLAIGVVKPKIIVLLGDVALQSVLKKQKIMTNRGQFFWSDEFNCHIFVTVHLSYCLNGAQNKYPVIPIEEMAPKERLIFKDFELLKSFISNNYKSVGLNTEKYKKVDDINIPENMKYIAIDSECTGLDLFNLSVKPLCWGFSYKEGESEVIIL